MRKICSEGEEGELKALPEKDVKEDERYIYPNASSAFQNRAVSVVK
ncbi:hypothetical protein OROGR_015316 [Orobanche gracilis]